MTFFIITTEVKIDNVQEITEFVYKCVLMERIREKLLLLSEISRLLSMLLDYILRVYSVKITIEIPEKKYAY